MALGAKALSDQAEHHAEEAGLLERARAGDLAAFDAIVVRNMRRAFAVALRLMRQREDAEDLVQDAFLIALQKLDRFQSGRPFLPWFYRILVNRGLNLRRARARRTTDPLPEDMPAAGDSPARLLERAEMGQGIRGALDALPDTERTIVELFELQGFDSGEIAEILDMPRGTVRWHLHQARRALRLKLAALHGRDV